MDYKQKYEEALKNLKRIKEANIGNQELVDFIEFKYPELSESEDERIRKELIRTFAVIANKRDYEIYSNGITYVQVLAWLEKQGEQKTVEPVTVAERDGEQWVRVRVLDEDFVIAAHDYRDGDKTEFTWEEACKIGTFSRKQGYIILALLDEINAKLEEIGGEPLVSYYWSSSECNSVFVWAVNFSSGTVNGYYKCYSYVARAVAAF